MKAVSSRERKLVALLILMALVSGLWLFIVNPIVAGFAERGAEKSQLSQQFANNERLIAQVTRLRKSAEQLNMQKGDFFLSAPSGEAATEILKLRLSETVEAAQGQVRTLQGRTATSRRVGASVQAQLTNDQLVDVLARLGKLVPYVVFDSVEIVAERALVSGNLDVMDVRIEISSEYDRIAAR